MKAWWRHWAGTIAFVLVLIVGASGFAKIESEGNTREEQFCGLVVSNYQDRVNRLQLTESFLETPEGMEDTGINNYVRRVSVPQSKDEITKEYRKIPDICRKYE